MKRSQNLHGWMEALYRERGGSKDSFNCTSIRLTSEHLDRAKRLPRTDGFFFGQSDGPEADDDLAFVTKAREALAANLTVFYWSWW